MEEVGLADFVTRRNLLIVEVVDLEDGCGR